MGSRSHDVLCQIVVFFPFCLFLAGRLRFLKHACFSKKKFPCCCLYQEDDERVDDDLDDSDDEIDEDTLDYLEAFGKYNRDEVW